MKAYVRKNHSGFLYDGDAQSAYEGFKELGEVAFYTTVHGISGNAAGDVIVGTHRDIRWLLEGLNIALPSLDYPEELHEFLGRKVWASTLGTIINDPDLWHVFIKPQTETKRFRGTLLEETKDLVGLGGLVGDVSIWCSEKVCFLAEWRAYVIDGEVQGLFPYKGDWRIFPAAATVERAVQSYKSAPRGYAIDFGVTDDGRTLLVEVNDGCGLGNYGLKPLCYARLLAARWEELTRTVRAEEAAATADSVIRESKK